MKQFKKRKISLTLILLLIIGVVGFGLRVYRVGSNPPSLYWDEVSIGYEAYSVAQTGKDSHGNSWWQPIFPAYGDYKAPVYIWITSLFLKIVPLSNFSVRLLSVLAGTMMIFLIYLLALELFDREKKEIGLLAALVMAILPWHLQFSRAAFEANLGLTFLTLTLYLILLGRRKGWVLPVAAMIGAAAVYSYFSVRFVLPVVAVSTVIFFTLTFWRQRRFLISGLFLFGVLLLPLLRSPFYGVSQQLRLSTQTIFDENSPVLYANELRLQDDNSFFSRIVHHRYWYWGKLLTVNIGKHLSFDYMFLSGDSSLRHGIGIVGLMYPLFMPFFLVGWYGLWRMEKRVNLWLLWWWLIALVPASVPTDGPHALRSLNAVPVFGLVLAVGFVTIFKYVKKRVIYRFGFSLYILGLLITIGGYFWYYHRDYPRESYLDWFGDYTAVARYLLEKRGEYNRLYAHIGDNLGLYLMFYGKYSPVYFHNLEKQTVREDPFDLRFTSFDKFDVAISREEMMLSKAPLVLGIVPIGEMTDMLPIVDYFYDSKGAVRYVAFEVTNHE